MLNLIHECSDTAARLQHRRNQMVDLMRSISADETKIALLLLQIEQIRAAELPPAPRPCF